MILWQEPFADSVHELEELERPNEVVQLESCSSQVRLRAKQVRVVCGQEPLVRDIGSRDKKVLLAQIVWAKDRLALSRGDSRIFLPVMSTGAKPMMSPNSNMANALPTNSKLKSTASGPNRSWRLLPNRWWVRPCARYRR